MTEYAYDLVRWTVAFVLLRAALAKLTDIEKFKAGLRESFNLTDINIKLVPVFIVFFELLLAGLLIANVYIDLTVLASFVLFLILTVFISYHWFRNPRVKCSCFGEKERPVSVWDILRNVLIIISLFACLFMDKTYSSYEITTQLLLSSTGLVLSILLINFHDVVMILRSE